MKFTKEEKIAFVKRCQDGETVLSICNENHKFPAAPSIAGYKTINRRQPIQEP